MNEKCHKKKKNILVTNKELNVCYCGPKAKIDRIDLMRERERERESEGRIFIFFRLPTDLIDYHF